MLTDIYLRLRNLVENIGFSFDEGGITNAEIMAYSSGLSLIMEHFNSLLGGILLTQWDNDITAKYCKMLSVYPDKYEEDELKQHILDRLSERFAIYTGDEFRKAFSNLGSGSRTIADGEITFKNMALETLAKLEEFIEGYIPFSVTVNYSGPGLRFKQWDEIGKCWREYDRLKLRFDVIDRLGGEEFE